MSSLAGVFVGGTSLGGTHRVFLNLRRGLQDFGHRLDLETCAEFNDSCNSVVDSANAVINRLTKYDYAIVNVFMSLPQMNIARYLPPDFPRVMIVHNITHATYEAARSLRDYVNVTIGVSERIRDDLIGRYGFSKENTFHIYNPVDPSSVSDWKKPRANNAILSLGRLEDASKGIFDLPRIFDREVASVSKLSIGGSGPDEGRLRQLFAAGSIEPDWLGEVSPSEVRYAYNMNSIFLFPSRFEGMGLALAEAMANGLVPVASRIPGVSDRMITDGETGFLFETGDVLGARRHLLRLLENDALLQQARKAAVDRAKTLFSLRKISSDYDDLIRGMLAKAGRVKSRPATTWSIPYRMRSGVRGLLPTRLRRIIATRVLTARQ